jgi:hypothetical protein
MRTYLWELPLKIKDSKFCKTHRPWKPRNGIFFQILTRAILKMGSLKRKEPRWFWEPAPKTGTDGSHTKVTTAQHC